MIKRQRFLFPSAAFLGTGRSTQNPAPSSFITIHHHHQKRQMSLMPVFEVAVELTESALVSINTSASTVALTSLGLSPVFAPLLTIFAFGFLMRLASLLTFTMFSDRAQDRFASAMPSLSKHFLLYAEVAWNPHALKAEIEMAATKLHERRSRTMSKFKTGNAKVWIPKILSMSWVAAGCAVSISLAPACLPGVGAAAASFSGLSCLPVIILNTAATGVWMYNFENYLNFRRGFWDQRDVVLEMIRKYARIGALVWILFFSTASFMTFQYYIDVSAGNTSTNETIEDDTNKKNPKEEEDKSSKTIFSHGQQAIFILLPFYFLGATFAGLLRFHVLHKLTKSILSSAVQWPRRRPKLHGTYGEYRWSYPEHLATIRFAEKHTGETKRAFDNYEKAKVQLEYDCDQRLSKMPMFKNMFADSRYSRRPDMPAPPEDFHAVRGGGSNVSPPSNVPDGAELRTTQQFSRSGNN